MIEVKDEILSDEPRYRIRDDNGAVLYDNLNIEMITPVTQAGTPINKALFDSINYDFLTRIPAGLICMWSGTTVPTGWLLCDGTNGTPDLRNRFIVGAGSSYKIGNTGGSDTVALTEDELPSHTHTVNSTTVKKTFNVRETLNAINGTSLAGNGYSGNSGTFTIDMGSHTHTLSDTGSNQAHENRPPYYALAYIMKQ